jgi:hypothetical protein
MMRGSRKHILDWVSQKNFSTEFIKLINLRECTLGDSPVWQPNDKKSNEIRLENNGDLLISGTNCWENLAEWWLVHRGGANKPNWDLVFACNISAKRGLVLVEAKAHERELSRVGKQLKSNASHRSCENHDRIGKAITEAGHALNAIIPGVNLSRDTHYQLANRLAYSWKIASMGIPVILLYLGFTGDKGIGDVGKPIENEDHWKRVMREYTENILPENFPETSLNCEKASMKMIVRSRAVLQQSPRKYDNK